MGIRIVCSMRNTIIGVGILVLVLGSQLGIGSFITVFDGSSAPIGVPISLDVTKFLRRLRQGDQLSVGFSLRTNFHGAQVNFSSLELGSTPQH